MRVPKYLCSVRHSRDIQKDFATQRIYKLNDPWITSYLFCYVRNNIDVWSSGLKVPKSPSNLEILLAEILKICTWVPTGQMKNRLPLRALNKQPAACFGDWLLTFLWLWSVIFLWCCRLQLVDSSTAKLFSLFQNYAKRFQSYVKRIFIIQWAI